MNISRSFLWFSDLIDRVARVVVAILMAAMCVVVLLGVFFRYVLGDALTWTEEAGRYLMIWMGFLATGLALREGGHVAVDTFLNNLQGPARRIGVLLLRFLGLSFLVVVIVAGAILIQRIHGQITAVLGISAAWPYLAIPVGCLLTAIEMITLMIRDPNQNIRHADEDVSMEVRS
jgi:TRAP-type C4-dicarboxylate transport system permease small subunit